MVNEHDCEKGTYEKESSDGQMKDFYIVGIGASAGGLEALEQFFVNMPVADNMAFVVIQHLSPDYKSFIPELLSKHTKMKIYQIQSGMKISPGCVYLNPPKFNVVISNGKLLLKDQDPIQRVSPAIDTFFESLAREAREKAIAIILSGTGSDGARGCRLVKEAGGIVISQDERSAKFNSMPRSVISSNICDYIIAPKYMPEELLKYTGQLSSTGIGRAAEAGDREADSGNVLSSIYNIINKRYQIDFKLYKQSTVLRCIDRRMRINQIQEPEMYLELLKESADETERLYNSMLIGVTRFFRDEEAFNIIKNKVIPEIVSDKLDNSTIRVWVAGCSTGEEAYSLAILFREHMDTIQRNISVKIFATDIDSNAIEYANAGIYPDSISNDVSIERLNRYFIKMREDYQVSKAIREMVIFSSHNVISNPPFFKIDLLSCRNLLIYFQPILQTRILSTFQFAIQTNGFMFLGNSETTGELGSYFSTVDAKWKIFRRRESKKRPLIDDVSVISSGMNVVPLRAEDDYMIRRVRNSWEMDDIYAKLIEEILPPCVIVDENGELVQVYGDADRFLKIPRGRSYYDIQKMVPKELSTALGTAISKVRKEKKAVTYTNIKVSLSEVTVSVNLIVKPLATKKNGPLVLVLFEEIKNPEPQGEHIENYDTINKLHERIADLEQDLQYTKESLQTAIEEIETSSEEIQSANEELLVSNEELHSTNEQLQEDNVKIRRLLEESRIFDGMKNDFFSNLSHELRTPLNIIMSTLQLLQSIDKHKSKGDTDQNRKRYMDIMKQNCFRQLRLINNLIDITKIDSGFFEINIGNYDIINIVENITLSVSEYIRAKSINLIFDTEEEERVIACDPDQIERIMLNLLSNAIKFTDEGGNIYVNMYNLGECVQISVKDTGAGIPGEKLEIIFERFRQVDRAMARGQEGSGIGLSLVKSLVEMHGGDISVKSEYGKGSEFIIELPAATVEEGEAPAEEEVKLQSNVEKIHLEFSDIYSLNYDQIF